jgi:hypothetical protein
MGVFEVTRDKILDCLVRDEDAHGGNAVSVRLLGNSLDDSNIWHTNEFTRFAASPGTRPITATAMVHKQRLRRFAWYKINYSDRDGT